MLKRLKKENYKRWILKHKKHIAKMQFNKYKPKTLQ